MTTTTPHVRRTDLPWHEADRTECGQPLWTIASDNLLTRAEALAIVREQGANQARSLICWPCIDSTLQHPTWEADPVRALTRELVGSGGPDPRLVDDLRAVAELIARHPDEFTELRDGLAGTVSLAARRARRATAT